MFLGQWQGGMWVRVFKQGLLYPNSDVKSLLAVGERVHAGETYMQGSQKKAKLNALLYTCVVCCCLRE